MARRPPRQQGSSASTAANKRAASPYTSTPRRQSKRGKFQQSPSATSKSTPKKSQYFTGEHDKIMESEAVSESEIENEESGYEDEDEDGASLASPPSESDEEDDYSAEEAEPRKRAVRKSNGATSKLTKGQELWRPGVKTGLEPGQEVIIRIPKARVAGKTPYLDGTIHPNTFLFLEDLARNNDREWLKMHDADYRASKKDFDTFVECLTEKIIEKDETIPELPAKDLTFRIYRDIRFSPDPTPYKIYFSSAWSRTGRKGPYAAYYVQLQPGASFVGGGLWMPEAQPLALLRRDVDRHSHRIKAVLTDARLRKEFFGGLQKDEKKAVKAFVAKNNENALKTKPKGFEADNKNIDLLRLRNYTIGRKMIDEEVLGPTGLTRIADLIGILTPFITYLNSVVMPDANSSADDDDGNGDNGE
ncbi:MAG: hypothetical protein M1827_001133 [Pycnora praestabilis]|nr:MAG: hypothetical protein M1827_001133 [Pycnora praestabilis]